MHSLLPVFLAMELIQQTAEETFEVSVLWIFAIIMVCGMSCICMNFVLEVTLCVLSAGEENPHEIVQEDVGFHQRRTI